MYNILLNIHSVLRWVVLFFLVVTIIKSLIGWFGNETYKPADRKLSTLTLIFTHTQLIIGLILYFFLSPVVEQALQNMSNAMKQSELRFWAVEHLVGMIIAIILITIGHISMKRKSLHKAKFKTLVGYFGLALVLMIYLIPWDRF